MLVSITIIRIRIIDQRALAMWSSNGNSINNSKGNTNQIATLTASTPAIPATAMSQPQYAHARC